MSNDAITNTVNGESKGGHLAALTHLLATPKGFIVAICLGILTVFGYPVAEMPQQINRLEQKISYLEQKIQADANKAIDNQNRLFDQIEALNARIDNLQLFYLGSQNVQDSKDASK